MVYHAGHQEWIALKTEELSTAQERARQLLPGDVGEDEWPRQLVKLEKSTRRKLAMQDGDKAPEWGNAPER